MTFVMTLMAAPAQLGWQIPPGQHILKLSASPDDPSCKKAGLGYTLFRGNDEKERQLGQSFGKIRTLGGWRQTPLRARLRPVRSPTRRHRTNTSSTVASGCSRHAAPR